MKKIAIMTDSNSGITQAEGKELGIEVIPMPFYINDRLYLEDITLTQEEFYKILSDESISITTSMASIGTIMDAWEKLLAVNDEVVFIPMSSGLSGMCEASEVLARQYEGKVFVVDNQRISVTQRQSVVDAKHLADMGWNGKDIKDILEKTKFDSSIYITVDTLKYLKKGGRITPAAAAIGTILNVKPILQIQGERLDAYAKARGTKRGKEIMLDAIARDMKARFGNDDPRNYWIAAAYSGGCEEAKIWKQEIQEVYPDNEILMNPLSLSVSCHIGPGALAITCTKKLEAIV